MILLHGTTRRAGSFPSEGGAVIPAVDVPDFIIEKAASEWVPLSQGLVQFDPEAGLEELIIAWPTLDKQIRSVL